MDLKKECKKLLSTSENIVLATCMDGQPNARIITFAYDESKETTVYFTTFPGNNKITEFAKNDKVCFFPLTKEEHPEVQIRIKGIVKKSERSLQEVAPLIVRKAPDFQELVQQAGDVLLVYEINFKSVDVTIGMTDAQTIDL